jgi:hypothetical protein
MKSCDNYAANFHRYLHKELRGRELGEFLVHLELCAECRRELQHEEELSRLIHCSRPLYRAPDGLRDRVLRKILQRDR